MRLVIGLGPIGGNVGARLAELGQDVYGYDLNPDRVREWSEETKSPGGSDLAAVDWPSVDSVHIAVRMADQVSSVFESLREHAARPLTVFVHTTLAPEDARRLFSSAPSSWRAFEAPVSGGPQGAGQGSMTIFLAGPPTTDSEESLLADISGRVFRDAVLRSAGSGETPQQHSGHIQPGRHCAHAQSGGAARSAYQGAFRGDRRVDRTELDGDNFIDVQYDLLLKDVGLLRGEVGSLPAADLGSGVEQEILQARALLSPDSANE